MPRWGGGGPGYNAYPSGITPPTPAAGYNRIFFDDFSGPSLDLTKWGIPFQGVSYSSQNGWYLTDHAVVTPSIMNLLMYPDAAGNGSANGWCGAGIQMLSYLSCNPKALIAQAALRIDYLYGATGIGLAVSDAVWPPEIDYLEGGAANLHYTSGNSTEQFNLAGAASVAHQTGWHVWGVQLSNSTINFTINGTTWQTTANPSSGALSDAYGLCAPIKFGFNFQTGDPNNPAADPSHLITVANPYQMQIDWFCIDQAA